MHGFIYTTWVFKFINQIENRTKTFIIAYGHVLCVYAYITFKIPMCYVIMCVT